MQVQYPTQERGFRKEACCLLKLFFKSLLRLAYSVGVLWHANSIRRPWNDGREQSASKRPSVGTFSIDKTK